MNPTTFNAEDIIQAHLNYFQSFEFRLKFFVISNNYSIMIQLGDKSRLLGSTLILFLTSMLCYHF